MSETLSERDREIEGKKHAGNLKDIEFIWLEFNMTENESNGLEFHAYRVLKSSSLYSI